MARARSWLAAAVAVAFAAAQATAQPRTLHIRGQVTALDGQTLVVSTREGEPARITLAPNYQVLEVYAVEPSALEAGRDIGVVGERQADSSLRALAVLLYPRGSRGTTEGHFPWDLTPQSTMTNATIRTTVVSAAGRELTVTYRAEQARIVIPAGVPIVTYRPVPRTTLRAGVNVFMTGAQLADSTLTAARILVGRAGLIPPM
jgi:hypothetical protein